MIVRFEATATTVSWIPSESLSGPLKLGMDLKIAHFDDPPPDLLAQPGEVRGLAQQDRFRFANVLTGWIDVLDGQVIDFGYGAEAGLAMGSTTVRLGRLGATFRAASLPVLRAEPEWRGDAVRFVQTVGGATALPLPRPVPHPPFVQWRAPIVWTTLALTLSATRPPEIELIGASAFPRHWVYDDAGRLSHKSGLTEQEHWMDHSFGDRTPWGEADRRPLVLAVESALERQLSNQIMVADDSPPQIREVPAGTRLLTHGEPGRELFLVLDGVLVVEVAGERLGEVGPGAVLGERAILEGGLRTSDVTAVTPVRVAVARADEIDADRLRRLSELHRREID